MLPIFSVYVAYWRSSGGLFEMCESQEAGRLWKDRFLLCCAHGDVRLLPGRGRASPKSSSFHSKGSLLFFFPSPGEFCSTAKKLLDFFLLLCFLIISSSGMWDPVKFALFSWIPFYRNGAEIFFLSLYALPLAKTSSTALTLVRCCFRSPTPLFSCWNPKLG